MAIHIIIDGYNLIRQSPTLSLYDAVDLERGRQKLLESLALYRRQKRHRITVVFDGAFAPSFIPKRDRLQGVEIRFSSPRESADAVIKRMAARERERALVVSSDREVADHAARQGAATVSSRTFERKLELGHADGLLEPEPAADEAPVTGTRKKGPRHRLSKKERLNRRKLQKL